MNLSDAIEAGARLHPMGKRNYTSRANGEIRTCAFGAAYEAATGELVPPEGMDHGEVGRTLRRRLGLDYSIHEVLIPYPEDYTVNATDGERVDEMWWVISTLNDVGGYTREQIAAYLRTLGY